MPHPTTNGNPSSTFELFPRPSRPALELKSIPCPRYLGRTPASTAELVEILKENHSRWHIFFNKARYHNHIPATALAMWSLGANEVLLRASYDVNISYQRELEDSPSEITLDNWKDHLGDREYYTSYLTFFTQQLQEKGTQALLEEYIFSKGVNFHTGDGVTANPEMLNRTLDSIMHPMINIGHGLEFNLPIMIVDGMAQAAVHLTSSSSLITAEWFNDTQPENGDGDNAPKGLHSFTLLSRILKDPEMGNFKRPPGSKLYEAIMASHGPKIKAYADQWDLSGDLEKKVEELIWFWTLVYGVCGYEPNRKFNAELFVAHAVTSSLFLAPWVAHLSQRSARLLLRGWFSVTLAWYIGRGRPKLNIPRFFSDPTTLRPTVPGPQPTPCSGALSCPTDPSSSITPNPWYPILQATLVHPDEHVPKLQRALKHYAELFEHVEKGYFGDTELEGAEEVDGTLFLRAAVLSMDRFGWLREGQSLKDHAAGSSGYMSLFVWDMKGFFNCKE